MYSIPACAARPDLFVGSARSLLRFLPLPLGLALLLAAALTQEGTALLQATPTPDRLAQPTLPPRPSQADIGAQVYWLSCLPCHGDRGQGLTDEFRQTYPKEDQNCWKSGCHGRRPYNDGFTLPEAIPAVIGPGTLGKFQNAAILRIYILAAMPYWKPGSLSEEQTWQVTAFLLRDNGLWDARDDLDPSNAEGVLLGAPRPVTFGDGNRTYLPYIIGIVLLMMLLILRRIFRKRQLH